MMEKLGGRLRVTILILESNRPGVLALEQKLISTRVRGFAR